MEIDTKGLYHMDIAEAVVKNGKVVVIDENHKDPVWEYKMIYNSGIDGGWEKLKDGVADSHLYLLPSQNKYFTVDLSTKTKRKLADTKEGVAKLSVALTKSSFKRFWNKVEYSIHFEHEVFDKFTCSNNFVTNFMGLTENPTFPALAKIGMGKLSSLGMEDWYFNLHETILDEGGDVNSNAKLLKYIMEKAIDGTTMTRAHLLASIKTDYSYERYNSPIFRFFKACRGLYGVDTTKKYFIDRWVEDSDLCGATDVMARLFGIVGGASMINCNYQGNLGKAAEDGYTVFDAEALSNYLFVESKKQGKRKQIGAFAQLLLDDHNFQKKLYGKIREKYPKYLATHHDKMEDDSRILYEAGCSNDAYMVKSKAAKKFEGEYGKYKLIVLETAADVIDEAKLQGGTCVASYVEKVAKGEDFILSLRLKNEIEKPLVTLEIADNRPVQFLGFMNRTATAEEWDALYHILLNYYKEANLKKLYGDTVELIAKNKPRLEAERRMKAETVQTEL